MASFSWLRWLRSWYRPQVKTHRRPRPPLRLEHLETRLAPATHNWTGAANNGLWSTASNWTTPLPTPGTRDSDGFFPNVTFSSLATGTKTLVNDLTGLTLNSIQISATGYTLGGNQITLGDPSGTSLGQILDNAGAGSTATISLNVQLGGAAGTKQIVDVQSGATLTVTGQISGPASNSAELSKKDPGTLILTADNSSFVGPFSIQTSGGIVQIQNPNALGASTAGVTVGTNGQLQLDNLLGGAFTVTENLKLNGPGITNDGVPLLVAGSKSVTWAGNVELDSDSFLGSNVPLNLNNGINTPVGLAGSSLTITGTISDLVPATTSPRRASARSFSTRTWRRTGSTTTRIAA